MNAQTIRELNRINREFYTRFAGVFADSRAHPWPGFARAIERWPADSRSVLDVGCGEGRFARFVASRRPVDYLGLDAADPLLERARAAGIAGAEFQRWDWAQDGLPERRFSLVVAFGVLHHVPSFAHRRGLVEAMAARVARGGLLVLAMWRFADRPRFDHKVVPFDPNLDVEPGDFLLRWDRGGAGVRYCHFVDDAEAVALTCHLGLALVDQFDADGKTGDLNRYLVLQRNDAARC